MKMAHINEAVRNAFPVRKVTSSHTKKETVILAEGEIPEPELRKVIAGAGYSKGNRCFTVQWCCLAANIAMMTAVAGLLASLYTKTAGKNLQETPAVRRRLRSLPVCVL